MSLTVKQFFLDDDIVLFEGNMPQICNRDPFSSISTLGMPLSLSPVH